VLLGLGTVVGSELCGRDATAAAVRPDLVVIPAPSIDHVAGLGKRREPVLIEALIAELAVEALDVAVLHGAARLDQQVRDAVLLRPGDEGPAGELWPIVGTQGARIAAEPGGPLQHPHDTGAADAVVNGNVDALVGEVIGDGQAFQAATVGQRVADEIHAPDRIGRRRQRQRLALAGRTADLLAAAHGQVRLAIQAIDLLVVHVRVLQTQQVMQAAVAEPAARQRQFDDPGRQRLRRRRLLGRMAEGIAGQPRKAAGPTLAHGTCLEHAADRLALALRG